jgi:DNA-binding transcriptional ArsR family regulator
MQKRRQLMQIMHRSLASVLFPGYRRQVLSLLLLRPDESLHGREISRRLGLPQGTLARELRLLADVGLLTLEKRGNQTLYHANRSSPIFVELAGILRKTSGLSDVVTGALTSLSNRINVAFIFGSVARGAESAGSDVDLIVIGSVDFGTIVTALYSTQQQLGREINPKVFSVHEWKSKTEQQSSFTAEILRKPKLFLIGGENELTELAGHQPRTDHATERVHAAPARRRKAPHRRRESERR